jgi:virginiamycin A acetyltransferase
MPGVHIGDGAIIGANSVVASDIPPYAVAVGNPCRVVKMRFDDEFIAYLLKLKWWDWDIEKIEANFEALSSNDLSLIKKVKIEGTPSLS